MTKTPPVMIPAESAVGDMPCTPSAHRTARIATRIATSTKVVRPSSRLPSHRRATTAILVTQAVRVKRTVGDGRAYTGPVPDERFEEHLCHPVGRGEMPPGAHRGA